MRSNCRYRTGLTRMRLLLHMGCKHTGSNSAFKREGAIGRAHVRRRAFVEGARTLAPPRARPGHGPAPTRRGAPSHARYLGPLPPQTARPFSPHDGPPPARMQHALMKHDLQVRAYTPWTSWTLFMCTTQRRLRLVLGRTQTRCSRTSLCARNEVVQRARQGALSCVCSHRPFQTARLSHCQSTNLVCPWLLR